MSRKTIPNISVSCIDCGKERVDLPSYFKRHGGETGYRCGECSKVKTLTDPENRKKTKATMESEEYHLAASERKKEWWKNHPEQKELQSIRQTKLSKEMWANPEIRETFIDSAKKKWENPETRDVYLKAFEKRWEKEEEHEKMCVSQQKRFEDPLEHVKLSIAMKQRYEDHPEEVFKNRDRQTLRYQDPLLRKRQSEIHIEKFKDPEYKKSSLEKSHSPEAIKKLSESLKQAYLENPELGIAISKRQKEKMSIPENCPTWKGGVSFEPYCHKFNKNFKDRVRAFFGKVCIECGKTEKDNGKKLAVHHVNYDKMICCNDVKPLFITLCKSCHTKTNNNREYWETHFTLIIEERYNGKCYFTEEEMEIYKKINEI
jgi:hypothetical protein